ncbi:MAG: phosphotransferase family protein [Terriglobia bacterium]
MPAYLESRQLIRDREEVCVRELGGGVSNIVLLAERCRDPERRWVVKQSLEKLRVEDDWRSKRERIFREAEAIQSLRDVLGRSSLPEIIDIDRENFAFVMTAAPAGSEVWKTLLLAGEVDLKVASQAGELLGKLINAAANDPSLQERFQDRTVFDQLRIDPYYRTTAERHPEMRGAYERLIADSWSIRTALVHGDFSPKNILVRDGKIFLIDFEVVHWGDPAFDAGFLLNHLFLKALYQPQYAELYFQAALAFWRGLGENQQPAAFEKMTLRHLGGLMLARIDGKSPVEYIRDASLKERVRELARSILSRPPGSVEEAISRAAGKMEPWPE